MASTVERVLWGDHPNPRQHLRRTLVGFAALVVAAYALFVLVSRPPLDGAVGPDVAEALFGVVTFWGPPLAAAISTARRGGLLAALGVGVVPGVVFWVAVSLFALFVGPTGDASAWVLAAAFAVSGVGGAVTGYAVVAGGRLALHRAREAE